MPDARVVVVPKALIDRFRRHAHLVEEAGGVIAPVDMDNREVLCAGLAQATVMGAAKCLGEAEFEAAPDLRAVIVGGHGVDSIDLEAATRHGVIVGNTPDLCTEEVADHALMLLLAIYRRIPRILAEAREGRFTPWKAALEITQPWPRLREQTAGLLAFGHIARAMAVRCLALGLEVIAHDPYVDPQIADLLRVRLVSFDTLLEESDYLSIHIPLSPQTHHMVDAEALAKMKPTAAIINTARGAVVDEAAMIKALRDGKLAAAGLDVLEVEPFEEGHPLSTMPNVILTPHMAGDSGDSRAWSPEAVLRDAATVLRGGRPRSIQNPAVLMRLEGAAPG